VSKIQLMTPEEMERRLSNGEDEIDLSIEKWCLIIRAWNNEQPVEFREINSYTCALCFNHDRYTEEQGYCKSCPWPKHFNSRCDEPPNGLWKRANDALNSYHYHDLFRAEVTTYFVAVRNALMELRKERELEKSNGGDSTAMAPEGDDCKPTDKDTAIGERVQG
jgi:hypothetical protein